DPGGHVVYSNAAYLALTGAASPQEARPVERVFIGNPDVSEAVFRLLKAAREGKRQQEEVRIAGTDGAYGRWLRMRVRPLGRSRAKSKPRCSTLILECAAARRCRCVSTTSWHSGPTARPAHRARW